MWVVYYIIVACAFFIGVVTGILIADDSDEHDDID